MGGHLLLDCRKEAFLEGVDERTFWLGKVQKIRRKFRSQWGNCSAVIDLQNRPVMRKGATGATLEVRLNWFSKIVSSTCKFKYDHSDCKWMDVDTIEIRPL